MRSTCLQNIGSDHLALVSEFAFTQTTKEDIKNDTETCSDSAIATLPSQEDENIN